MTSTQEDGIDAVTADTDLSELAHRVSTWTHEQRRWLALLLSAALIRGLVYAAIIPPWQAPDETGHFEHAWLLAHTRHVPDREDLDPAFEQELIASLYEWRYGTFTRHPLPEQMPARMNDLPTSLLARQARTVMSGRFSLAYAWQALFLFPVQHQDLVLQLFIARLSSVLLNVGIVCLAFLTLAELFPSRPNLVVLATVVILLMPQHTFINSMVGEGTLAELMACLVLYGWVRVFRLGPKIWLVTEILLATVIGFWTKNTVTFLVPVNLGLAAWWLVRRQKTRRWRQVAYLFSGMALLLLGVWAWSRSPLGTRTLSQIQLFLDLPQWSWADQRGMNLGEGLLATYDNFWGSFGWMSLPLSSRWYGAIAALSCLSVWGWGMKRPLESPRWAIGMMGGVLGAALAVFVWVALLSRLLGLYQYQGRYLFPALIPFVFFFVGGLDRLLSMQQNRGTVVLVVFLMIVLDTWSLLGYILPYFYA